jgi:hypothetical protein
MQTMSKPCILDLLGEIALYTSAIKFNISTFETQNIIDNILEFVSEAKYGDVYLKPVAIRSI